MRRILIIVLIALIAWWFSLPYISKLCIAQLTHRSSSFEVTIDRVHSLSINSVAIQGAVFESAHREIRVGDSRATWFLDLMMRAIGLRIECKDVVLTGFKYFDDTVIFSEGTYQITKTLKRELHSFRNWKSDVIGFQGEVYIKDGAIDSFIIDGQAKSALLEKWLPKDDTGVSENINFEMKYQNGLLEFSREGKAVFRASWKIRS